MPGSYDFGEDEDTMAGYDTEEASAPGYQVADQDVPVSGVPVEEEQQPVAASAEEAQKLQHEQQEEDDIENYEELVSNVDKRLRIAQYFRYILDNQLFGEETTESRIVQNKIRKFAREQVEILFGMRQTPVVAAGGSQFSEEEIGALRALANATIAAKKRPELNKIGPKTPAPVNPVNPIVIKAPTAQPVQAPKIQNTKPATKTKPVAPVAQTPGQNPFQNDPRVPEQYRSDPTVRIKNGRVFIHLRNADNELLWSKEKGAKRLIPLLKDVTPPAQPVGIQPMPMPSVEALPAIFEARAAIEGHMGQSVAAQRLDNALTGRIL